jgi:tryptophan-rich sensory protein
VVLIYFPEVGTSLAETPMSNQWIILKRSLLTAVIFGLLIFLGQSLLLATTHLTVTECTFITIAITGLPAALFAERWLLPWFGWELPTRTNGTRN